MLFFGFMDNIFCSVKHCRKFNVKTKDILIFELKFYFKNNNK